MVLLHQNFNESISKVKNGFPNFGSSFALCLFALKVQLDHLKDKKWPPEFREPIRTGVTCIKTSMSPFKRLKMASRILGAHLLCVNLH